VVDGCEIVPGDRPETFLLRLSGMNQSCVDLADPTRLVFEYVQRMADVLDAVAPQGEPVRVVHVGGAALTLPRYVAATRPGSAQVVLEPAAEVTELVRRELPLPARSGIKVRPVDGRSGVAALREATPRCCSWTPSRTLGCRRSSDRGVLRRRRTGGRPGGSC